MDHKRFVVMMLLCFLALAGLAAQDSSGELRAVVAEIEGKVEYKDGAESWKALKVGTVINRGTMISTGFKSTATLKLGEDTVLVKPVTRLSLEDLVKTEGGTRTKLFLTVGRVKAEVNPSKREKVDFSIKSATATASVRGTGFETDGTNLLVTHGMVQLENRYGQFRYVGAGEYSKVDSDSSVTIPVAVNPENGLERLDEITDQAHVESVTLGNNTVTTQAAASTGTVNLTLE
jgi:hypothetical protein